MARRDCTLGKIKTGTNREKKSLREQETQPSSAGAQAESSVLPHIALNYSLQCAELLFYQLLSLTGIFNYRPLGMLWGFLLFFFFYNCQALLHVILKLPTFSSPWILSLCFLLWLSFISASFMTSLLFIFQSILNLDPTWEKIREDKSPLSLSVWRNSQKLIPHRNGLLLRN